MRASEAGRFSGAVFTLLPPVVFPGVSPVFSFRKLVAPAVRGGQPQAQAGLWLQRTYSLFFIVLNSGAPSLSFLPQGHN